MRRPGFPKTIRNDRMADGTAISKYIGRDSLQSLDNYPIITQNLTEQQLAIILVLLRYAKYCFRSINDTINQNIALNDTIIL